LTVHLFALARERAGSPTVTVNLTSTPTVADLRHALATSCPNLAPLIPSLLVAVNSQYARDEDPIPPNAELAVFPPVSGG
jgi:molybdopterin converting factor subunit 1